MDTFLNNESNTPGEAATFGEYLSTTKKNDEQPQYNNPSENAEFGEYKVTTGKTNSNTEYNKSNGDAFQTTTTEAFGDFNTSSNYNEFNTNTGNGNFDDILKATSNFGDIGAKFGEHQSINENITTNNQFGSSEDILKTSELGDNNGFQLDTTENKVESNNYLSIYDLPSADILLETNDVLLNNQIIENNPSSMMVDIDEYQKTHPEVDINANKNQYNLIDTNTYIGDTNTSTVGKGSSSDINPTPIINVDDFISNTPIVETNKTFEDKSNRVLNEFQISEKNINTQSNLQPYEAEKYNTEPFVDTTTKNDVVNISLNGEHKEKNKSNVDETSNIEQKANYSYTTNYNKTTNFDITTNYETTKNNNKKYDTTNYDTTTSYDINKNYDITNLNYENQDTKNNSDNITKNYEKMNYNNKITYESTSAIKEPIVDTTNSNFEEYTTSFQNHNSNTFTTNAPSFDVTPSINNIKYETSNTKPSPTYDTNSGLDFTSYVKNEPIVETITTTETQSTPTYDTKTYTNRSSYVINEPIIKNINSIQPKKTIETKPPLDVYIVKEPIVKTITKTTEMNSSSTIENKPPLDLTSYTINEPIVETITTTETQSTPTYDTKSALDFTSYVKNEPIVETITTTETQSTPTYDTKTYTNRSSYVINEPIIKNINSIQPKKTIETKPPLDVYIVKEPIVKTITKTTEMNSSSTIENKPPLDLTSYTINEPIVNTITTTTNSFTTTPKIETTKYTSTSPIIDTLPNVDTTTTYYTTEAKTNIDNNNQTITTIIDPIPQINNSSIIEYKTGSPNIDLGLDTGNLTSTTSYDTGITFDNYQTTSITKPIDTALSSGSNIPYVTNDIVVQDKKTNINTNPLTTFEEYNTFTTSNTYSPSVDIQPPQTKIITLPPPPPIYIKKSEPITIKVPKIEQVIVPKVQKVYIPSSSKIYIQKPSSSIDLYGTPTHTHHHSHIYPKTEYKDYYYQPEQNISMVQNPKIHPNISIVDNSNLNVSLVPLPKVSYSKSIVPLPKVSYSKSIVPMPKVSLSKSIVPMPKLTHSKLVQSQSRQKKSRLGRYKNRIYNALL